MHARYSMEVSQGTRQWWHANTILIRKVSEHNAAAKYLDNM